MAAAVVVCRAALRNRGVVVCSIERNRGVVVCSIERCAEVCARSCAAFHANTHGIPSWERSKDMPTSTEHEIRNRTRKVARVQESTRAHKYRAIVSCCGMPTRTPFKPHHLLSMPVRLSNTIRCTPD